MSCAIIHPIFSLKVWFLKKSRKKGEKPNVCMCVCMWVSLAYLLTIGCLRRVARVCKDHLGGYRWILLPPPLKKRKKKKRKGKIAPMRATIETKSERGSGAYQIASRFITSASWTAAGHFKKEASVPHRYTVTSIQSDAHQAMDQPSGPVHWSTTSCCRPLGSPTYYRLNHLRLCRVFDIK